MTRNGGGQGALTLVQQGEHRLKWDLVGIEASGEGFRGYLLAIR
jgi:hypothetical protein